MSGRVALVGAGPGDPKLLTLRAAELLAAADVVAHDELVPEAILALAPKSAERLRVGRRVGDGPTSYRIHPDVLARARAGKRVVRLKAGDPLVFGRGGEEAEELAKAGIPFEIVPGITAALGAAASACIPLTHRDCAAQALLTTAHRGDGGAPPPSDVGRTLVLYMASRELAANLAAIVRAGWPGTTPAALVLAATTPRERTIVGTLETLAPRAEHAVRAAPELPGIVFVGEVVRVRDAILSRARAPMDDAIGVAE
jgi:uroporphyrinogen III methyltransferase/synthase